MSYDLFKKRMEYLGWLFVVGDESACATPTKDEVFLFDGGGWLPDLTRIREDPHYIIQHEKESREIRGNNCTLVLNAEKILVAKLFSWQ